MIPTMIDAYLREHGLRFEHFVHGRAIAAQKLAAAEHVTGSRVAKVVVVSVDGKLALAVVAATERVDIEALREALHAKEVELVPETRFAERFWPCEAGAEPPLSLFGVPIYVDAAQGEIGSHAVGVTAPSRRGRPRCGHPPRGASRPCRSGWRPRASRPA